MSSLSPEELTAEISTLGNRIRELKLEKKPVADEVARLKELKALLPPPPPKSEAELAKEAADKAGKGKGKKTGPKEQGKLVLKTPKVSFARCLRWTSSC